jgi:hypothetical protein
MARDGPGKRPHTRALKALVKDVRKPQKAEEDRAKPDTEANRLTPVGKPPRIADRD